MFVRLEEGSDIRSAVKQLAQICERELPHKAYKYIGYPAGGRPDCLINHDNHYWFWQDKHSPDSGKGRYLNWFGKFDEDVNSLSIALEVNTYFEGLDRRVAGFFARDMTTDRLYLMHNGGIGGGRKGQSKSTFLKWRGGSLVDILSSDGHTELAIPVMALEGRNALETAFAYIDEVHRFKQAVRDGSVQSSKPDSDGRLPGDYYPESSGRRKGRRRSTLIDYVSRHGMIVDSLKNWRSLRPIQRGARFTKDILIDLSISTNRKILELYEVKTGSDRQSIYSAIGQLLVHDRSGDSDKYLVIPDDGDLQDDVAAALKRMDIAVIRFDYSESGFSFRKTL